MSDDDIIREAVAWRDAHEQRFPARPLGRHDVAAGYAAGLRAGIATYGMRLRTVEEGNCPLNAAAPDLLAALVEALPYLEYHATNGSGNKDAVKTWDMAEAAIAKARGEK